MVPQPRKIWPWMLTAVFVIFLVQSPEAAAQIVSGTVGLLSAAAESVGVFVETL